MSNFKIDVIPTNFTEMHHFGHAIKFDTKARKGFVLILFDTGAEMALPLPIFDHCRFKLLDEHAHKVEELRRGLNGNKSIPDASAFLGAGHLPAVVPHDVGSKLISDVEKVIEGQKTGKHSFNLR